MYGICTTFIAAEKIEAGESCFVGSDGKVRKSQKPVSPADYGRTHTFYWKDPRKMCKEELFADWHKPRD